MAEHVEIIGHRGGAAGRYPENSIRACEEGVRLGADVIELDTRITIDGRVVICHDERIDRVTTGSGAVARLSLSELRQFPLRHPAGAVGEPCRIPSLEEVFERLPTTRFNIDLKSDQAGLARAVADLIARYNAIDRVTVASFIPAAIEYFRRIAPDVATATHPEEVRALIKARLTGDQVATVATRVQVPRRNGIFPLVTAGFVRHIHNTNRKIDVWTINDLPTAQRLVSMGVDGIITDDVALLRSLVPADEGTK